MKHDLEHEEKQNEAIRQLAAAVASVAGHLGLMPAVREAHAAAAIVAKDEAEPAESPAAPVEAQAELPKAEEYVEQVTGADGTKSHRTISE